MESLGELIRLKHPQGIPYDEAVQLLLWIYASVDILPERFRKEVWDRSRLIREFEQMGNDLLIRVAGSEHGFGREWWSKVIDEFLCGHLDLDETFPERSGLYL